MLDGLTEVDRILSAGTDKSSIVLGAGLQVDLMVCPPAAWGTHLVHFTGSKEHNVALRGMALDRGLSLSEKGFKVVETGELLLDDTEEAVYARLDLPWIPPEMREDTDVLEVARKGTLPELITVADLKGDTHVHSDWTDGVDSIEVMARASRDRGREWMVLTDHSPSLGVTRGLTLERIVEQKAEIDRLNAELAPFRILHGTEMEIRADGSLDYPDELLAVFDLVVAIGPYRANAAVRAADRPHAGGDREPARGRDRASDRAHRQPARPDAAGLASPLCRCRAHRYPSRDERQPAPGPGRRAGPRGGAGRRAADAGQRRPSHRGAEPDRLRGLHGAAGVADS